MNSNEITVDMAPAAVQTLCVKCATEYGDKTTGDFDISVICDLSAKMFSNTEATSVTHIAKILNGGNSFHQF
jgi:hypothetical protein